MTATNTRRSEFAPLSNNPTPRAFAPLASPEKNMTDATKTMESWRSTWRKGFAPVLPLDGLKALKVALETDDRRLTQGSTTTPPPLMCVADWICEAGCPIATCGVAVNGGYGVSTVGSVEEFFARACFDADQRLGDPAACRWFLNWVDDTPRDRMRSELLAEVNLAIAQKENGT